MSLTRRSRRTTALALATAGVAGSLIAGVAAAGAASAAPAVHPDGFVTIASCSSVTGSIQYSPGLRKTLARNVSGVLTATTGGCSDIFSGAMSGNGSLTAVLQGKASLASENFTGTFTINWPASSGFNPSNGTLSVTAQGNHMYAVSGTVTSGFDTGTSLSLGYLTGSQKGTGTKAHPVVRQNFVNTSPLGLSRNEG